MSDQSAARDVILLSWRTNNVAVAAGVVLGIWRDTDQAIGHVMSLPAPGAVNRGRLPMVQLIFESQSFDYLADEGGMSQVTFTARVIVGGVSGTTNQQLAENIMQAGVDETRNTGGTSSDYWKVTIDEIISTHETGAMYHIFESAITCEVSWEREH